MKEYTFTSLTPSLKKTNLMLLALGISYIGYKIYNKIARINGPQSAIYSV